MYKISAHVDALNTIFQTYSLFLRGRQQLNRVYLLSQVGHFRKSNNELVLGTLLFHIPVLPCSQEMHQSVDYEYEFSEHLQQCKYAVIYFLLHINESFYVLNFFYSDLYFKER